MKRRDFIKSGGLLLLLLIPQKTFASQHINTFDEGLAFPFYFPEKSITQNYQQTNNVQITNFKSEGFFSQLWHELLQLIK